MKIWRRLPDISAPMPFQMALDEVLFRKMEKDPSAKQTPVLRFFFSSEPWMTTGYFYEDAARAGRSDGIPAGKIGGGKIPVCRRLTGGGQVLHGKDLIFSVISGKKEDESFGSVEASYRKIHEAVKQALESAGVRPGFYKAGNYPKGAECFVFPIESDLELAGRKIAGGSQKRSSGTLLHHESVQLPQEIGAKALIPAMCRAFEETFKVRIEDEPLNQEDLRLAKELSAGGYVPGRFQIKNVLEKSK